MQLSLSTEACTVLSPFSANAEGLRWVQEFVAQLSLQGHATLQQENTSVLLIIKGTAPRLQIWFKVAEYA